MPPPSTFLPLCVNLVEPFSAFVVHLSYLRLINAVLHVFRRRLTFDLISHAPALEQAKPIQPLLSESPIGSIHTMAGMDESKKPGKKREVDIPDCPVHSVVVYPDRAEVG